jgi:rhamnogalacturonan endolyase
LSAFTEGEVGEFCQQNVEVKIHATNNLGKITWNVPRRGKHLAWEIGVPDRTAKEFRHGTDYFQGFLWKQFSTEFSNPLTYDVGKSNWSKDWNYAQTFYTQNNQLTPHTWNIHFTLSEIPHGNAVLTLAIASADHACLAVCLNDNNPPTHVTPAIQGGNALQRESIHAKYCVEYVTIPADHFRIGENILSLALTKASSAQSHVMYDYLSLELP